MRWKFLLDEGGFRLKLGREFVVLSLRLTQRHARVSDSLEFGASRAGPSAAGYMGGPTCMDMWNALPARMTIVFSYCVPGFSVSWKFHGIFWARDHSTYPFLTPQLFNMHARFVLKIPCPVNVWNSYFTWTFRCIGRVDMLKFFQLPIGGTIAELWHPSILTHSMGNSKRKIFTYTTEAAHTYCIRIRNGCNIVEARSNLHGKPLRGMSHDIQQ